jgi:hypothetical protein
MEEKEGHAQIPAGAALYQLYKYSLFALSQAHQYPEAYVMAVQSLELAAAHELLKANWWTEPEYLRTVQAVDKYTVDPGMRRLAPWVKKAYAKHIRIILALKSVLNYSSTIEYDGPINPLQNDREDDL